MSNISARYLTVVVVGCITVVLLLMGRAVTPIPAVVLSWDEWKIFQANQVYGREIDQLSDWIAELIGLLENPPDPVRTQLITDEILAAVQEGTGALAIERELVRQAALDTRDWSLGAVDRAVPLASVEAAGVVLGRSNNELLQPVNGREPEAFDGFNSTSSTSWEELLP